MSTHASIAVQHKDGTITQVYCHFDGYLSYCGKNLLEHYNTREMAEKLVQGGNMSSLGVSVDLCEFYNDNHPYAPRFSGWNDYDDNRQSEQFDYVFTDSGWAVNCYLSDNGRFIQLQDAIDREEAEDHV